MRKYEITSYVYGREENVFFIITAKYAKSIGLLGY